ncbi:serine/threonine-protein kinase [Rhodobium gokarnense]|uniref:Serine/threonine protein kinase n=1 Tax=Rhodobium gokarnense TaxID=364296 RepID=A0ABT3H851_9HYPH|nr:serine/threonine-protein kinase [Rhodobium gokarnense]MCW2306560.1 serine/threonine protein kinase [Rhodobium gokarnense]
MADDALPLGFELGDYRIDGILGQGGFAIVYRATHTERGYRVAVKELFPHDVVRRRPDLGVAPVDAENERVFDVIRRDFDREAALLFRFPHPYLPRIHAVLGAHDTFYLVMDFETGQPLDEWILAVPVRLRAERAMDMLGAVCEPLERLHRNDVFHNDIKPDNILVRDDGTPVLLDFGLAGYSDGARALGRQNLHFASDGYSPVELYTGGATGPWTDVYALAATAYRLLDGHVPVSAKHRARSIYQGGPDPIARLSYSPRNARQRQFLEAIAAGLRFDAAHRPQSLADWGRGWRQAAVLAPLPGRPKAKPGARPRPGNPLRTLLPARIAAPLALAFLLLLVLAVCLAALFAR